MFRNTPYSSARGALCLFWATGFAVRRQGMRRLRSAQFSGERNQLLHTALRHAHSPRSFLDGKWCVRDVDFGLHGYALSVAVLLALMNTRPAVRPHGTRAPSSQRQEQPVASCGAWVRPPSSQPPRWKGSVLPWGGGGGFGFGGGGGGGAGGGLPAERMT